MARQNPETEDDFIRMQQEAIERVRDMQRRARATLENAGMHIEGAEDPFPEAAQTAQSTDESPAPEKLREPPAPVGGPVRAAAAALGAAAERLGSGHAFDGSTLPLNLGGLSISLDHDQLILLAMILFMIQDGADKWLILALSYVMLT